MQHEFSLSRQTSSSRAYVAGLRGIVRELEQERAIFSALSPFVRNISETPQLYLLLYNEKRKNCGDRREAVALALYRS